MTKLKTLQDLQQPDAKFVLKLANKDIDVPFIMTDDLRSAAREWVDFIMTDDEYGGSTFAIDWIRHFFNLEDG